MKMPSLEKLVSREVNFSTVLFWANTKSEDRDGPLSGVACWRMVGLTSTTIELHRSERLQVLLMISWVECAAIG